MAKGKLPRVPISELSGESGEPQQFSPVVVEVPRDEVEGEALYWYGVLLMEGTFDWNVPDMERNQDGEFTKTIKVTAKQLWYTPDPDIGAFWAPRNRYLQNISLRGVTFVAYTERFEREATNEWVRHPVPWPGTVSKFTDSKVREILETLRNSVIRPTGEPWSYERALLIDYRDGHMPGCPGGRELTSPVCPICAEIESKTPETAVQQKRAIGVVPAYRKRGDLPVADYVYFQRIPGDRLDWPPSRYHELVPSMEKLFNSQPPPVSADLARVSKQEGEPNPVP